MNYVDIIGIIAGTLTTIAFVPQLLQVLKTKSAKDISLAMFIIFATGVFLWFAYGILSHAMPVIIANGVVFVLALIIIYYKIKYS